MANLHKSITEKQAALIRNAAMFFVASAAPDLANNSENIGPVNLSPKGGAPLHILSPNRVAYLDYPGSGNETARHALAGGPITVMVCSFEDEDAAIVRLYGKATVTPLGDSHLSVQLLENQAVEPTSKPRQIIEIEIELTMTSCGYGAPVLRFEHERRRVDPGRRYKG